MDGILENPSEILNPSPVHEPEVGEEECPSEAYNFEDDKFTHISGSSADLHERGYTPFPLSHLNTTFALTITQALARVHAMSLISQARQEVGNTPSGGKPPYLKCNSKEEIGMSFDGEINNSLNKKGEDLWTRQISQPHIVGSNLKIIVENFKHEGIISRVTDKLKALQTDVETLSQFVHFAAALQTQSRVPSVGPICMCDVWIKKDTNVDGTQGEGPMVIRKRGGSDLEAPPLRDVAWVWLTLLRPEILRDRYVELCEAYCSSFNEIIQRENATDVIEELTLFDIMKDLGENFLHGFLTMVHKFVASGVWTLDRQLHTREGVVSFSDSINFLVDNGIVGSIFVA